MKKATKNGLGLIIFVAVLALFLAPTVVAQIEGWTTFTGIQIQATSYATATPLMMIENNGDSNSLEIRNSSATPVFYVDADGNATYTGFSSGGGAVGDAVAITAPTAVGTATPALVVNSLGAGNVLLDVRDAATPVFSVNNGGSWTSTGAGTHSSGQTINNWAVVAAPTAIATATPAMVINSAGVSNILEVRDGGTAVAAVNHGGNWIIGTTDGTGVDMTWYSDTAGDTMLWDQSEEALTITGTNGQDALNVDDGNVDIADDIDVDGTANLDVVDIDGAAAFALSITQEDGNTTVADNLVVVEQSDITVTDGAAFTATGTIQPITAAGEVTPTITAGAAAGTILVLYNSGSNTINIADTGTAKLSAAAALGQYDSLTLISDGTNWIEISKSDN